MKYFQHCKTQAEIRKLFHELVTIHHPDKGGDLATMQEITAEYDLANAKILKGENLSTEEINGEMELSEKYRQAVEAIINLPGIVIEVVGTWLWVRGATFEHRSKARGGTGILHEAGFLYANKKDEPSAWFFRTEENKVNSFKKQSLEEIKAKYGSTTVNSKFASKAIR